MAKSIQSLFAVVPDPRREQGKRHVLTEMITLSICAVLCGADGWSEIAEFGQAKIQWFRTFLRLPHGIPSHDTFGRVFAVIDPEEFEKCFVAWTAEVATHVQGVLAIDGKTLRHSFDQATGKAAIHLVSAWAADNSVVFGQIATDDKSNEITAIPKLLQMLDLHGLIITIDAMGCQKDIARQIVEQGGDYVLQVKGNQPALHQDLQELFDWALPRHFRGMPHDTCEQIDKDHGRIETRRTWVTWELSLLRDPQAWAGLRCVAMVQCQRTIGSQTTTERHYYISSLPGTKGSARELARACRHHWRIENQLHWCLDVAFREDDSRVRLGHAPENLSRLRRIALNLLKRETTRKIGIKAKRLRAGWDHDYLLKVLQS